MEKNSFNNKNKHCLHSFYCVLLFVDKKDQNEVAKID